MSDLRKGIDVRAARTRLGLSTEGLRILLRLSPSSGPTIRRWQSGDQDVPGPVEVLLELLVASPAAREAAGVPELAARHPAFTPGRPASERD